MKEAQGKPLKPHWFQILLALADRDLHGLQIMEEVSERTEGAMHLWPGMLYGSLKAMAEEGLVAETSMPASEQVAGGRPRYYGITKHGRKVLIDDVRRLSNYVSAARAKNLLRRSDA
ncbi:MAG: helix-turn-helix transcriptional regulator [Gemmatimonadota bacterium]|nr:MAG: helix-turn-helix transcriptional regulator [Gemmatimonadota bacterium]